MTNPDSDPKPCPCLMRLAGDRTYIACFRVTSPPWSEDKPWPGCASEHQPDCRACDGTNWLKVR